jgi:hypothetical protein
MSTTAQPAAPKTRTNSVVSSYSGLLKAVREEGLLKRRRSFYITTFIFLCAGRAGRAAHANGVHCP